MYSRFKDLKLSSQRKCAQKGPEYSTVSRALWFNAVYFEVVMVLVIVVIVESMSLFIQHLAAKSKKETTIQ